MSADFVHVIYMSRIIDLSLPIDTKTTSPPSQAMKIEVSHSYRKPGWWQASRIGLSVHTGTHIDSPLHVIEGTPSVGEIRLERLVGEATVLDLTNKTSIVPVDRVDLEKFDEMIRPDDIIILRTDWTDTKWGTDEYWNKSPYLTEDGAKYLIQKKPKAVGFDFFEEYSARLKDFKPDDFLVHKIILGSGTPLIEGLTNLGEISKQRVNLFALPLKLMVAEAAPARVIAVEY